MYFWYLYIFMHGFYCKYHNELCYKDPIRGMIVRFSFFHDGFTFE